IAYNPSGQSVVAKRYGSLEDALSSSDPDWIDTMNDTDLWENITSSKGDYKCSTLIIRTDQPIQIKLLSRKEQDEGDVHAISVDDSDYFNITGVEFANLLVKTTVETNVKIIIY